MANTDPRLSIRVTHDPEFELPTAISDALAEVGQAALRSAESDDVEGFGFDGLKMGSMMPQFTMKSSDMFGGAGLNVTCEGTFTMDPKTGDTSCKTTYSS